MVLMVKNIISSKTGCPEKNIHFWEIFPYDKLFPWTPGMYAFKIFMNSSLKCFTCQYHNSISTSRLELDDQFVFLIFE